MSFTLLLIVILIALYFVPTFIGLRKRNAGAIFVLNLLLGWTFVGWVVALVWALTVENPLPANEPARAPIQSLRSCSGCNAPMQAIQQFCHSCGAKN